MISFGLVDPDKGREAYNWHRGFAGANDLTFPRTWDAYGSLAQEGQIWCATDAAGDYQAMAYYAKNEKEKEWEIGGIMVAAPQRGRGLGSIIARLALGHVLTTADPLASNEKVIAHVHDQNQDPRPIIENVLRFEKAGSVSIPGTDLPGLRMDASGFVKGDKYQLFVPDSLIALAGWCEGWKGKLKDGTPAEVDLLEGITLKDWAIDLRAMVAEG